MEVRLQGKEGKVASLPAQVAAVTGRLTREQQVWRERLRREPSRFGEVEVAVHHAFQEMADQVVAGLLADVGQQAALENARKKSC
jgi:hypothetical protein